LDAWDSLDAETRRLVLDAIDVQTAPGKYITRETDRFRLAQQIRGRAGA